MFSTSHVGFAGEWRGVVLFSWPFRVCFGMGGGSLSLFSSTGHLKFFFLHRPNRQSVLSLVYNPIPLSPSQRETLLCPSCHDPLQACQVIVFLCYSCLQNLVSDPGESCKRCKDESCKRCSDEICKRCHPSQRPQSRAPNLPQQLHTTHPNPDHLMNSCHNFSLISAWVSKEGGSVRSCPAAPCR